jgi:hypothetical protein
MTPAEKDHRKWLDFAIALSRTDVDSLTVGEKLDLENRLSGFLESIPDPRSARWVKLLTAGEIPAAFAGIAGLKRDDAIELKHAKEVLAAQLENLAGPNVLLNNKAVADILLWRMGDSFQFLVSPKEVEYRLIATLGSHLVGAGIPASWLRRCPQCGEIFLATRNPRPDRKLHCSKRCSANAATRAFRSRRKEKELKKKKRRVKK